MDGAEYLSSLLAKHWPGPGGVAIRMAHSFIRAELGANVELTQLTIVREDELAFYVAPKMDAHNALNGAVVRVTKDGQTVQSV